uniref:(northern house mosquito) hypothetical protein n=1 Tax=Culex pipiens TaxID=7175 RepID=A0A8D8KGQ3_CULPI
MSRPKARGEGTTRTKVLRESLEAIADGIPTQVRREGAKRSSRNVATPTRVHRGEVARSRRFESSRNLGIRTKVRQGNRIVAATRINLLLVGLSGNVRTVRRRDRPAGR